MRPLPSSSADSVALTVAGIPLSPELVDQSGRVPALKTLATIDPGDSLGGHGSPPVFLIDGLFPELEVQSARSKSKRGNEKASRFVPFGLAKCAHRSPLRRSESLPLTRERHKSRKRKGGSETLLTAWHVLTGIA